MQTNAKFYEVFAPKISFFPLSTNLFHVVCRSCKYLYHLPPHQFLFVCIFVSESKQKKHDFKVQVHKRKEHLKLPCNLTRQGKYCECHPTHSFQFIIIMGSYRIHFINQLCALYIAFDNCFYIFDVIVVKSLYIAFLIHKEQFAFPVHALRITRKFDFGGTLSRFLSCEIWFFPCIVS